jgi:hypothetical protein
MIKMNNQMKKLFFTAAALLMISSTVSTAQVTVVSPVIASVAKQSGLLVIANCEERSRKQSRNNTNWIASCLAMTGSQPTGLPRASQ